MNKFEVRGMDLYYGSFHALKNINIDIPEKEITAFIGPSGCGKSTFLKTLNRMNDLVEGCRISGDILLDDGKALDELVQTHHSFIDIARDAGDVVAQHRAVDDDGVQSSSSFSQWEQSSSSCCQSAMRRSQYSFSSRSKRSSLKERLCSRISSLE